MIRLSFMIAESSPQPAPVRADCRLDGRPGPSGHPAISENYPLGGVIRCRIGAATAPRFALAR